MGCKTLNVALVEVLARLKEVYISLLPFALLNNMFPTVLRLKPGKDLSIAIVNGAMCLPEMCVHLLRRSIVEVEEYGILTGDAKAATVVSFSKLVHRLI